MKRAGGAIPLAASLLAAAYLLAALAWSDLLPVVAGGAAVAACALVVHRRPGPPVRWALGAVAVWLGGGFAGAWLLRDAGVWGLAWLLGALFLAPLPLVPWLYARTFGPVGPGPGKDAS